MREQWDGVMACHGPGTNNCWSPKHPQLMVRSRADDQSVHPTRPAPDKSFVQVDCGWEAISAIAGLAVAGCAIAGLDIKLDVDHQSTGTPTTDQGTL